MVSGMKTSFSPDRLRELREGRALSREALARLADLTLANLAAVETGRNEPRTGTFLALADALEVDPLELCVRKAAVA
jgi:transcriptional regulator with XRE-family HTH domain